MGYRGSADSAVWTSNPGWMEYLPPLMIAMVGTTMETLIF